MSLLSPKFKNPQERWDVTKLWVMILSYLFAMNGFMMVYFNLFDWRTLMCFGCALLTVGKVGKEYTLYKKSLKNRTDIKNEFK